MTNPGKRPSRDDWPGDNGSGNDGPGDDGPGDNRSGNDGPGDDGYTDAIFRAGAPAEPDPRCSDRIARRVLQALEARRKRQVRLVVRLAAAVFLTASLAGLASMPWFSSPDEEVEEPVASERRETNVPDPTIPAEHVEPEVDPAAGTGNALGQEAPDGTESETEKRAQVFRRLASLSPRRAAEVFWSECVDRAREAGPGEARAVAELRASPDLDGFLDAAMEGITEPLMRQVAGYSGTYGFPGTAARGVRAARRERTRDPGRSTGWEDRLALAFGRCRRPQAWPLIEALLEARGCEPVAIRAAGDFGDHRAVSWLRRWVYLADARGRAAVDALGRIPGEESGRVLLSVLASGGSVPEDLWPGMRGRLVAALERRRDETLGLLLEACRRDPGRASALETLLDLFPEEAAGELPRLFIEVRPGARPIVGRALARLGNPEAMETLFRALEVPGFHRVARQSLRTISGRDLGADPRRWRRWYRETL